MPKIQLIVIGKNINPVNYCITYFDIDYCKVIADGSGKFYTIKSNNNLVTSTKVSDHIFNVFELLEKNIELLKKGGTDVSNKYYATLINSVKFYIIKVKGRINKYTERGVSIDPANYSKFLEKVQMIENIMIITKQINLKKN